jgi:hypothetical protein
LEVIFLPKWRNFAQSGRTVSVPWADEAEIYGRAEQSPTKTNLKGFMWEHGHLRGLRTGGDTFYILMEAQIYQSNNDSWASAATV